MDTMYLSFYSIFIVQETNFYKQSVIKRHSQHY